MSVPIPMEDVNITVLIQLVATIVHVLIVLTIHSVKMATVAMVSFDINHSLLYTLIIDYFTVLIRYHSSIFPYLT